MTAQYSISIIHPSFELLRNASRLLHFMAAAFIALNAFHQLSAHEGSKILCYAQLVIAADLLILVFFAGAALYAISKTNVLFRLIEGLCFGGIALSSANEDHPLLAVFHLLCAGAYLFICYREWRVCRTESIQLRASGITIPNFIADANIKWLHVKRVVTRVNSILIETVSNEKVEFELKQHLKIEELEQINDFCREKAMLLS